MAFSAAPVIHPGDSGPAPAKTIPAACEIWFTSTGRVIPRRIKFPDETGVLHTLSDFFVCRLEHHRYCGIPSYVYYCRTAHAGKERRFRLFFYPEKCIWRLIWD